MKQLELRPLSPFIGLRSFEEVDAPLFFGRKKETQLVIANMFAAPLTLLYGASGVGKSSVLRAGVMHNLHQREDISVVLFNTWQDSPTELLASKIYAESGIGKGAKRPKRLSLSDCLTKVSEEAHRRVMIILDQFEEYFLYHQDRNDEFATQFSMAVMKAKSNVSFLISLREDSLAKLDRFEGRIPHLFENYLRIEHLSREAAHEAVTGPINYFNSALREGMPPIVIEDELIRAVLNQVRTGRVVLEDVQGGLEPEASLEKGIETPYLQVVMARLWEEELSETSYVLRSTTLERLGGAENIIKAHLGLAIQELTSEEQSAAAELFKYLVTPSGTKIAHTLTDLENYTNLSREKLSIVLNKLSRADVRILRPVRPPSNQDGEQCFEIFHDVLSKPILNWRRQYVQSREKNESQVLLSVEELGKSFAIKGVTRRIGPSAANLKGQPRLFDLQRYIEPEAIKRYLNESAIPDVNVIFDVRWIGEYQGEDPIMVRPTMFDALIMQPGVDQFVEVRNINALHIQVFDRLYVMASKVYWHREASKKHSQLLLLLYEFPEQIDPPRTIFTRPFNKLEEYFSPAIMKGLLKLGLIRFDERDYEHFVWQYYNETRG